jgi:hypothetical protein
MVLVFGLDCFLIGCLTPILPTPPDFIPGIFGGEGRNRGSLYHSLAAIRIFITVMLDILALGPKPVALYSQNADRKFWRGRDFMVVI